MSLYAQYLSEYVGDRIVETPKGYATYRFMNDNKSVYIIDIYVIPDERKTGYGSSLAEEIVQRAKKVGSTELLGTVSLKANNPSDSFKVLLAYGMKPFSATNDIVIFRKDI